MQLKYFALVLLATGTVSAKEIHVSPRNTVALGRAKAGDTVWFKGGRYAEPVEFQGLAGTADKPITLTTAPGEKVVFDGTDVLSDDWKVVTPDSPEGKLIQPAQWQRMRGKLYCLKLDKPIYALVYDGRLMSDARWPNARWEDPWRLDRYMVLRKAGPGSKPGEIHDGLPTENTLQESKCWIHYDRGQLKQRKETLADTGLDFTGSSVLLSCFWASFGTRITEHAAGQDHFQFDTAFNGSGGLQKEAVGYVIDRVAWDDPGKFKRSSHGSVHFFLMGLPALDIPEEWFYHQASKTLFFVAPDGKQPEAGKARGKRRDYAITIENSSHVHLKGFEFSGAAALLRSCTNSRIEDCNFRFSAHNKFAIGNYDMPVTTEIQNARSKKAGNKQYGNALINCRFEYLDGNAFKGSSTGLTVDNVRIYQTQMTTLGNDSRSASFDEPLLVRRITISDVGASVGIKGGGIDSVYELNNITRIGGLQYDGASLQMGGTEQKIYRWNWSHDHPKFSYRFDTPHGGPEATHGEMSFNVAWNTPGGYMVKGDEHLVQNNLLLGDGAFVYLFNLPEWASINDNSLAANNAVPGFFADRRKGKAKMLATLKNNTTGSIEQHLRDPANLDFRLKKDSPLVDAGTVVRPEEVPWKTSPITRNPQVVGKAPDIGAYEYGASSYWIPGFKFPHASTPIPPDKTVTAKPDCDLMWLAGYQADRHDLYFGTSAEEVAKSTRPTKTFRGDANIFAPGPLVPGNTYFWRIDATRDGETIRGEVWSFTVQSLPQPVWKCAGLGPTSATSPVATEDTVFCMTYFGEPSLLAISLDSQGDVTDTDKVVWRHDRDTPYVPSPIVIDDTLYILKDKTPILTGLNVHTGEVVSPKQRLRGLSGKVYASPVAVGRRLYFTCGGGETLVLQKQGDDLKELALNELNDSFHASPAIAGNRMYLRGEKHLYCIEEK